MTERTVDSKELFCTCDIEDVGMGHARGCPVGECNRLRMVMDAGDTMNRLGVPLVALEPVRLWLADEEKMLGIDSLHRRRR